MISARITDPITSKEAAASVAHISEKMQIIVDILKTGPADETHISQQYDWLVLLGKAPMSSPSGLRTLRANLVKMGIVEESGQYSKTPSGRRSIIWRLVASDSLWD